MLSFFSQPAGFDIGETGLLAFDASQPLWWAIVVGLGNTLRVSLPALLLATALALTKAGLNRSFESDLATSLLHEATAQAVAFSSDYHDETVRNFMAKKPPLYKWPSR